MCFLQRVLPKCRLFTQQAFLVLACLQLPGSHPIGVTAVSWSPAIPAGALVGSAQSAPNVKRLVTSGCDNTIRVGVSAPLLLALLQWLLHGLSRTRFSGSSTCAWPPPARKLSRSSEPQATSTCFPSFGPVDRIGLNRRTCQQGWLTWNIKRCL